MDSQILVDKLEQFKQKQFLIYKIPTLIIWRGTLDRTFALRTDVQRTTKKKFQLKDIGSTRLAFSKTYRSLQSSSRTTLPGINLLSLAL